MPHEGGTWLRTAEGALVRVDDRAPALVPVKPELVPAPEPKKEPKP
jgi:hypothetical protein